MDEPQEVDRQAGLGGRGDRGRAEDVLAYVQGGRRCLPQRGGGTAKRVRSPSAASGGGDRCGGGGDRDRGGRTTRDLRDNCADLPRRRGGVPTIGIRPRPAPRRGGMRAGSGRLRAPTSERLTHRASRVIGPAIGGKTPGQPHTPMRQTMQEIPYRFYLHWDNAELSAVEILRRAHDLITF